MYPRTQGGDIIRFKSSERATFHGVAESNRLPCSLLLCFALVGACAPISTNTRIEETVIDQVVRSVPNGPMRVVSEVETTGSTVRIVVRRNRPCIETRYDVVEQTAFHERRDARRLILWEWLGGAVLAGGGAAALAVAPSLSDAPGISPETGEETVSDRTTLNIIGIAALVAAVPTLAIAITDSVRARDRREVLPRTQVERERRQVPCGADEPIAGRTVGARHAGLSVSLGNTNAEGVLEVDLAELLSSEVVIGPPQVTSVRLFIAENEVGTLDLRPYLQVLAEREWGAASEANTIESLENFARRFPTASRADEARERANALSEESAWVTASFSDTAEALEDFAERYPASTRAEEARTRARTLRLGEHLASASRALDASDVRGAEESLERAARIAPGDPAVVQLRQLLRALQIQARAGEVLDVLGGEMRTVRRARTEIDDWGRVNSAGARRRVSAARRQISEACVRMNEALSELRAFAGEDGVPPSLERAVRQVERSCRGR